MIDQITATPTDTLVQTVPLGYRDRTKIKAQVIPAQRHSPGKPWAIQDAVNGTIVVPRAVRRAAQSVAQAAIEAKITQDQLLGIYLVLTDELLLWADGVPEGYTDKLGSTCKNYTKVCQKNHLSRAAELIIFNRIKPVIG